VHVAAPESTAIAQFGAVQHRDSRVGDVAVSLGAECGMTDSMPVLDRGMVRLVDSMGSDLSVVRAARVSTGSRPEDASKGEERDAKLIRYLLKHDHGTPFEHNAFTFYIKAPVFIERQWLRHRIGSFNEISGRYTEYEPEFYVPDHARGQASSNKQGSVPAEDPRLDQLLGEAVRSTVDHAFGQYQMLLQEGIAREIARLVLPLNLYTEWYWTVNARSLMNFLRLRTADDAQLEMREYARAVELVWSERMPLTYAAWQDRLKG
jgi:thymidylate synthase (FAD)